MSVAQKDILNGWKEIAGYVARDIRTVERWEKQRGLPVRRVPGAGRATVYARISELEQWLDGASLESDGEEISVSSAAPGHLPGSAVSDSPTSFADTLHPAESARTKSSDDHAVESSVHDLPRNPLRAAVGMCLAVLLVAGTIFLGYHRHATAEAHSLEGKPSVKSAYSSPVAGVEDLYLRGTYFYEQRTPETLNRALSSFNQAIALDPRYAPAYAGLADTYNLLREYSGMPDSEAFPKAEEAARRAISLDPDCGQAHASLGYVEYFWAMDPKPADAEFRTALKLNPNSPQARHWYGSMLTHEGRYTEALEQLAIAQRLEPSSAAIFTSRAMALGLSGHSDEARAMLRDLLSHDAADQDRNSITAHMVLSMVYMATPRDVAESLSQAGQAAELRNTQDQLDFVNVAEPAFRAGGERAMWQAVLAHEEKLHSKPNDRTYLMAQAEANLGEFDRAFADLNLLADKKTPLLAGISMSPLFVPLHADPRYTQLRIRLGLPSQN